MPLSKSRVSDQTAKQAKKPISSNGKDASSKMHINHLGVPPRAAAMTPMIMPIGVNRNSKPKFRVSGSFQGGSEEEGGRK